MPAEGYAYQITFERVLKVGFLIKNYSVLVFEKYFLENIKIKIIKKRNKHVQERHFLHACKRRIRKFTNKVIWPSKT